MRTSLHPYERYRDSRVAWIGRLPAHWEVARLKQICTRSALYGANIPASEYSAGGIRFVRTTDVREDGTLRSHGVHVPDHLVSEHILEDDDLLISRSGATVGKSFLYKQALHGPCSYAGYLVRFQIGPRALPEFVYCFTKTVHFAEFIRLSSVVSTIENVNGDKYANSYVPLPPGDEQHVIVRFLNVAERKFKRLVRNKRRLIALLNEEKQAIIQQAVTRGLDPDVPMKPSGVEWMGEIPANWQATKLYRITDPLRKIMYGIVLPGPNVDDGVYIVKGGNCEPGRLRPELLSRTTREIEANFVRSRLKETDIVYAIRGSIGAASLVPEELDGANLTQDAARIAPGADIDPKWLLYGVSSRSFFSKLDAGALGATIRGINIRDLKRADIAVPPMNEQREIARFLDQELSRFYQALDQTRREIDLIREYRTRLIADVVTGQLDVRNVQLDDEEWSIEEFDGYHPGLADEEVPIIGDEDELVDDESDVA